MEAPSYIRIYFKNMGSDDFPYHDLAKLIEVMRGDGDEIVHLVTLDGAATVFRAKQIVGLRTFTPESRKNVELHQKAIEDEVEAVKNSIGTKPDWL